MKKLKITIFTYNKNRNILLSIYYILKYFYFFFRRSYYKDLNSFIQNIRFSGHVEVVRSLHDGLKENNIEFNINPKYDENINENIIVLSGANELKKAINLKKKGIVKKILAGPNIVVMPSDYNGIINNPYIDKVIVPCEWVKNAYIKQSNILVNKIEIWQAGIDSKFWINKKFSKSSRILIYFKNSYLKKKYLKPISKILKNNKLNFHVISYGNYNKRDFRTKIHSSSCVIFITTTESQSIAQFEIWASGLPIIVNYVNTFKHNKNIYTAYSSPFLNKFNGIYFESIDEINNILNKNINLFDNKQISDWIKRDYDDKSSSLKLINLFNEKN